MSVGDLIDIRLEVNDASVRVRVLQINELIRAKLRRVLPQLGRDVANRAKALAPFRFGTLRDSIRSKMIESDSGGFMETIGPPIFYGRFFEFGVPEQVVHVNPANDRRRSTTTGRYVKGRVRVGFTKRFHITARPFMRPAMELMRSRILEAIGVAVSEGTVEF